MKFIKDVHAHCDLFCGVYDPAQARIEAQAVANAVHKYHESDDPVFKQRAIAIKEERAQLVKEHLWVLWTDYFKPPHLEQYPDLHDRFWKAAKLCSEVKVHVDQAKAEELLNAIKEIHEIFWKTKDKEVAWYTAS